MIAIMGTKEEPIFISSGEDESVDENPTIMINSSSDEEDCQTYSTSIKHNKDGSSMKSKLFDKQKMNDLRVSIRKLNPTMFQKKLGQPESNHHTQSFVANGLGNAAYNISDDEEQPGQKDSEPINGNIENRSDISFDQRPNATSGSYEIDARDEEGLFEKMKRLGFSSKLNSNHSQNGSPSKSRDQNIDRFLTILPNQNYTPTSSPAKTKTFSKKSNLLRQTTFESLSPNKKLFTALPVKRQFQALPLTPPLYNAVTLPLSGSYRGVFTEAQMNSINVLEEELEKKLEEEKKFDEPILKLILQYISRTRAPPSQLVFDILKTLLRSEKAAVTELACSTLKRIHVLHPRSTDMYKCGLDWNFISSVVDRMELTGCLHEKNINNINASLVFAFIIYFLEKECKRKMFSTSVRKCHAFKLLSLNKSFRNVREVLFWIKEAIIYHTCSICVHSSSVISKNKSYLNAVVSGSSSNLPCSLLLVQHLLQLVMLVNEKPATCAIQLADELVSCYLGLHHLQMKIFLLQTIESHMVRSKMIDSVLQCRFPMEDCPITGLLRIVEHHFFRELHHDDIDSSEDLIKQECEEFVMLLAYLMQSYICTHEERLQAQQDNLSEKQDNVDSDGSGLHLSVEDVVVLCDIDQHVKGLQQRLQKTCPIFSERTYTMFQLMTSLNSFTR